MSDERLEMVSLLLCCLWCSLRCHPRQVQAVPEAWTHGVTAVTPQTALAAQQGKTSGRFSHNSHAPGVPFLGNCCILKGKYVWKGELWVQLRTSQRKSIIQTSS